MNPVILGGMFERKRKCGQEDTFPYFRACPKSVLRVGDLRT
jgi:hypothetical protein